MTKRILFIILAALVFVSGVAVAAPGGGSPMQAPDMFMSGMVMNQPAHDKVTILSPADGATVESDFTFKLKYKAVCGPNGDHLHLSIDGKRVAMIHQRKGTTDIYPLAPGKHQICLSIHTKEQALIGVEKCISVISK